MFPPASIFVVDSSFMSTSLADQLDVEVVLDVSQDIECDVDVSMNAVVGEC